MSAPINPAFVNRDDTESVTEELRADERRRVWQELREKRKQASLVQRQQAEQAVVEKAASGENPDAAGFFSSIFGGAASGLVEMAKLPADLAQLTEVDVPGVGRVQPLPFLPQPNAADTMQDTANAATQKIKDVAGTPEGLNGLVWGLAQFATGAKVIKGLGLGKAVAGTALGKAGALGRTIRGATGGAVVDFTAFDPEDNIIAEWGARAPVLGPLFEQLKTDPEDPEVLKRLKSTLVGMGVGVGFEHMLAAAKVLRFKSRLAKDVQAGSLRIEDFDPNGIDLAKKLALARGAYKDAKEVVGVTPKLAEMMEKGRERVKVSQDVPINEPIQPSKVDTTGTGDTVTNEYPGDATQRRNMPDDKIAAAVERVKGEREQLRGLRDELEQAWAKYEQSPDFLKQRPDVQQALRQVARGEVPRVELVPTEELASEQGRRVLKGTGSDGKRSTLLSFQERLRANLTDYVAKGDLPMGPGKGHLNLHLMGTPDEQKVVLNTIRDELIRQGKGGRIQAGTKTWAMEDAETARLLGMDNAQLLQHAGKLAKDTENAAATVRAIKIMLKGYSDELLSAAVDYDEALKAGFVPPEVEARAMALFDNALSAYMTAKGATGNIARALNYMRRGTGDATKAVALDDLERAKRTVFGGNVQFARVMKGVIQNGGDFASTYKWLEAIEKARSNKAIAWGRAMHELFVSNALGALRTHTTNQFGNAAWHVWDVVERDLIGTAIQRRSVTDAVKSTAAGYAAMVDGLIYLTKAAAMAARGSEVPWNIQGNANARAVGKHLDNLRAAWRTGEAQLLTDGSQMDEIGSYWNPEYLLSENASAVSKGIVNGVGKWTGLMRRALATGDELWANHNYFIELRRRAYLRGLDNGLSGKKLREYVASFEENIADAEAAEIQKKSLELARRNVFQSESQFANTLNSFRHTHPALGLVADYAMPFKRTPHNLFKLGVDRTPVGLGWQIAQAAWKEDAMVRRFTKDFAGTAATEEGAEWLSRYTLAMGTFATMYFAYRNGFYQGSAVSQKERDAINAQGGLEHSFITTRDDGSKEYTQVLRADPIALPIGFAADLFGIADHLTEADEQEEWTGYAMGFVMALQSAFRNRSYLGGLTMALDVIAAPTDGFANKAGYYLGQMAGTQFVPNFVPHANAQVLSEGQRLDTRVYDSTGKVAALQSALQQFKARMGLDGGIPPRRTIFGAQMLPEGLADPMPESSPGKPTPGADEFRRLDMPVDLTAWSKDVQGVVLKPGDRARLGEDLESARIGGKSLVEALDARVQAPTYQRLTDDQKRKDLGRIVERYKKNAEAAFLRRPGMANLAGAARVMKVITETKGKDAAREDSRVQALLNYYR